MENNILEVYVKFECEVQAAASEMIPTDAPKEMVDQHVHRHVEQLKESIVLVAKSRLQDFLKGDCDTHSFFEVSEHKVDKNIKDHLHGMSMLRAELSTVSFKVSIEYSNNRDLRLDKLKGTIQKQIENYNNADYTNRHSWKRVRSLS